MWKITSCLAAMLFLAVPSTPLALQQTQTDAGKPGNTPSTQPPDQETKQTEQEDLKKFWFKGKPIYPAFVEELVTSLDDRLPVVVGVDLEGAMRSGRYWGLEPFEKNGGVRYERTVGVFTIFFAYKYIGTTPGGTHVLRTANYGGGTGLFEDVLFVKFETNDVHEQGKRRSRVVMKYAGSFGLGDRSGMTVELQGKQVIIGKPNDSQRTVLMLD